MGRRNDCTGVPHTCPLIDEVISFIDNIPFDSEWTQEEIEEENIKCVSVKEILEEIRTHNGALRDFGIGKQDEFDDIEREKYFLEIRVKELEAEVESLEKDVEDLQSELLDLS